MMSLKIYSYYVILTKISNQKRFGGESYRRRKQGMKNEPEERQKNTLCGGVQKTSISNFLQGI